MQVQSNGHLPPLSSITSTLWNICTLQLWTMDPGFRARCCGRRGSRSGIPHCDLLTARVEMSASIHEQIWGSNHHSSTPKRADWKLIKNASVRWMTDSFCWSSALKEEAGRSRVPGAGEPPVASAIVSLPGSCLISGSISMKPLSCSRKC